MNSITQALNSRIQWRGPERAVLLILFLIYWMGLVTPPLVSQDTKEPSVSINLIPTYNLYMTISNPEHTPIFVPMCGSGSEVQERICGVAYRIQYQVDGKWLEYDRAAAKKDCGCLLAAFPTPRASKRVEPGRFAIMQTSISPDIRKTVKNAKVRVIVTAWSASKSLLAGLGVPSERDIKSIDIDSSTFTLPER